MFQLTVLLLAMAAASYGQIQRPVDEGMTDKGPVRLTIINHASMMIEGGGKVIHVDPVGPNRYEGLPAADLILITHVHGDHTDAAAVARLRKEGTLILGPEAVAKKLEGVTVIRNGERREFGDWSIEAVPAYNLKRGPSPGAFYHPKGEGNGYLLSFGGIRAYIAGDTEAIPEMKSLGAIDAAFLPMNLPFTMTPEEVAEAARMIRPRVLYPYHYRGSDLAALQKALENSGIEVRVRNWYY